MSQLLPDAKLAENAVEHVVGADGADDFAQGVEGSANFGRDKLVAGDFCQFYRGFKRSCCFAKTAQATRRSRSGDDDFVCVSFSKCVAHAGREFIDSVTCNAAAGYDG